LGAAASVPSPPPGGWLPFELPLPLQPGGETNSEGPHPAIASGDALGLDTLGEDGDTAGVQTSRGDLAKGLEHLTRAQHALPDSTLFAACHAQMLTHQGNLPAAYAQLMACARAGQPSACAEELCLRWLQRYRPTDTHAILTAAVRLLQVDPTAEAALPLLEEMVREAPNRARGTSARVPASPSTDANLSFETFAGAPFAFPLSVLPGSPPLSRPAQLLWLIASRVELRAHEPRSWQLLTLALGRADLPAAHVCNWWDGCRDWWPDFALQIFYTAPPNHNRRTSEGLSGEQPSRGAEPSLPHQQGVALRAGIAPSDTLPASGMPPVVWARASCARALVTALQAWPEGAPLARSAGQVLRPLLQWADADDTGSAPLSRVRDGADGRINHGSGGRRGQECGESAARGGKATEGRSGPRLGAIEGSNRRRPAPARTPFESASSEDDSEEINAARPAGICEATQRSGSGRVGQHGLGKNAASQLSQANSSQQSVTAWI
jgi:hypothetical protein